MKPGKKLKVGVFILLLASGCNQTPDESDDRIAWRTIIPLEAIDIPRGDADPPGTDPVDRPWSNLAGMTLTHGHILEVTVSGPPAGQLPEVSTPNATARKWSPAGMVEGKPAFRVTLDTPGNWTLAYPHTSSLPPGAPRVVEFTVVVGLLGDFPTVDETDTEVPRGGTESLSGQGPDIVFEAPEPGMELTSPVRIDIRFEATNERSVDIASFRLKARKGPFWIDISNRVREFVSENGIFVEAVDLGDVSGRHRLRMAIGYLDGGITEKEFIWIIRRARKD